MGYLHSCPYKEQTNNNALTNCEVNKALNSSANNGYGCTAMLQQCLIEDNFSRK